MKRARSEFSYLEFLAAHYKHILARILWHTDRATVAAFEADGLFDGVIAEFRLLERFDFNSNNRYDGLLDFTLPDITAVCVRQWTVLVNDSTIMWYWFNTTRTVSTPFPVAACAIGDYYTVIISKDGKAFAASHTANSLEMKEMMTGHLIFSNVYCGDSHCVLLTTRGEAWAWGINDYGQVGVADVTNNFISVPAQIAISESVALAACGADYTLLLTSKGHVFACGQNNAYQLGTGTTNVYKTPTRITLLPELVTSIAAGDAHSVFCGVSGSVYSCGFAGFGCTGQGESPPECVEIPTRILFDEKVTKVACGSAITVFITANRTVYYCGWIHWPHISVFDRQAFVPTRVPAKYPVVDAVCGNSRLILKYAPAGVDTGFPAL